MSEIIIICGPTASGKSAFAHSLAHIIQGEIINADAMQVYDGLKILTASPILEHILDLPYHLYNFLDLTEHFSLGKYVSLATSKITKIIANKKIPIIVGGTGMYISSLLYGYSEMPKVELEIQQKVRAFQQKLGQEQFYQHLIDLDPQTQMIQPNDSQRSSRALEIFYQTGKSIYSFTAVKNIQPLKGLTPKVIYLLPDRKFLYDICNARLKSMFIEGAIEEVQQLSSAIPNLQNFAGKAIGFREILDYLDENISYAQALESAQTKTRQYAKRQITWFNNQILDKIELNFGSQSEYYALVDRFCKSQNIN